MGLFTSKEPVPEKPFKGLAEEFPDFLLDAIPLSKKNAEAKKRGEKPVYQGLALNSPEDLEAALPHAMLNDIATTNAATFNYVCGKYNKYIRTYLNQGILTDADIETAARMHAVNQGRAEYYWTRRQRPHDCLDHYLIFALREPGVLTERQKKKAWLSHGNTIDEYCGGYRWETLVDRLKERLLDPPEDPVLSGDVCCCS